MGLEAIIERQRVLTKRQRSALLPSGKNRVPRTPRRIIDRSVALPLGDRLRVGPVALSKLSHLEGQGNFSTFNHTSPTALLDR